MQYWESIADKLSAAGWSWGYCSAVTPYGWRWVVDAHKNDGKRTSSNLTSCWHRKVQELEMNAGQQQKAL